MSPPTNRPRPPPQPPGLITSSPHTLATAFDLTAPILRFDFATPAAQATFHRAFLQVRSEKDKAAFMTRFFDNYDGQVSIPRRVVMDTSQDEELARRLQESLPVVLDTARDGEVARRLQEGMRGGVGVGWDGGWDGVRIRGRSNGGIRSGMDREMDGGNGGVRTSDSEEAWRVQRRIQRQRELQHYGIDLGGGGYDNDVETMRDRFGRMAVQGRGGAYPPHPGPEFGGNGYGAPRRNPRLPPRYPENRDNEFEGYRGNDGTYAPPGYDPRWENWSPRGPRY